MNKFTIHVRRDDSIISTPKLEVGAFAQGGFLTQKEISKNISSIFKKIGVPAEVAAKAFKDLIKDDDEI